jgi:16S rRNA (guanine1516-N2)-methyltransferase
VVLSLPIWPRTPQQRLWATELACRYGLTLVDTAVAPWGIEVGDDCCELVWQPDEGDGWRVSCDFSDPSLGYRLVHGGGRQEPLARAIGIRAGVVPSVVDATAGWGREGWLLAALGCRVTLLEQSPVVALLLADGLRRAAKEAQLAAIAGRIEAIQTESCHWLNATADCVADVIYLDPMFPERHKRALVKKEMQALHQLVGADYAAADLLAAALQRSRHRVVVKRPHSAPALEGPAPHHALQLKKHRYDIYIVGKMTCGQVSQSRVRA